MAEQSDLEDLGQKPEASSAPVANGQSETAPAGGLADAAPQSQTSGDTPQAQDAERFEDLFKDDERPQVAFEDAFKEEDRGSNKRPGLTFPASILGWPTAGVNEKAASAAAMNPDDWSAYMQNTPIGRSLSAFGEAFTGPGMNEEVQKWFLEMEGSLDQAQEGTNSIAQTLMRPVIRGGYSFLEGFATVPVMALDFGFRTVKGIADAAVEATKDAPLGLNKLARDTAAMLIDMEMNWGGIVPGGKATAARLSEASKESAELLNAALRRNAEPLGVPATPAQAIAAEEWAKRRLENLKAIPDEKLSPIDRVERDWLATDPHGETLLRAYPLLGDALKPKLPEPIAASRANAVIAEGEEGYMGTATPTEADLAARRAAAADLPSARVPDASPAAELKREEAPDLITVARNINPQVVDEYQGLVRRKQDLVRWLDDLRDKREADIDANPPADVAELDRKIAAVQKRLETRRPGATSARLTDLQAEREAAVQRHLATDNEDMRIVRADLVRSDLRMRDLATDYSRTLREAEDLLPPPAPEPEIPAAAPEIPPPVGEAVPSATQGPVLAEAAPGAPAGPAAPVPKFEPQDYAQHRAVIATDVAERLKAVGRPAEEAEAVGAIESWYWSARSQRNEGRLGTPLEMYERMAPSYRYLRNGRVLRPSAEALELAQGAAPGDTFFSALELGVEGAKDAKGTPEQWSGIIRNLKGVKAEEVEWSGVLDWLAEQKGPVTREQVLEHIRANTPRLEEVIKGGAGPDHWNKIERLKTDLHLEGYRANVVADNPQATRFIDNNNPGAMLRANELPEGDARDFAMDLVDALEDARSSPEARTRYSDYQLPGGENYREMLLTLPNAEKELAARKAYDAWQAASEEEHRLATAEISAQRKFGRSSVEAKEAAAAADAAADTAAELRRAYDKAKGDSPRFQSSHWSAENILAHMRFNDRTGPNGEHLLHIEEIQSDWHQKGRRHGYNRGPITGDEIELKRVSPEEGARIMGYTDPDWLFKQMREWRQDNDVAADADLTVYRIKGAEDQPWNLNFSPTISAEEIAASPATHLTAENRRRAQGVPDAPFKSTWHELAFRRMLRWAAENGYDGVTWTTGEQQAARYDLSKTVDKINVSPRKYADRTERVVTIHLARGSAGSVIDAEIKPDGTLQKVGNGAWQELNGKHLSDVVGKDLAQQIINGPERQDIAGDGLRIGGDGMKGFYDGILRKYADKLGKKFGAKVGEIDVDATGTRQGDPNLIADEGGELEAETPEQQAILEAGRVSHQGGMKVHYLPITDAMRDSLMEGQALFQGGVPRGIKVDTPEFRKWFEGSVLKNEDGSPLVLYHGTADDLHEFDLDHPNRKDSGWLGRGIYMTDDPGLASSYASLKAWDVTRPSNAERNVMPLYASLKNPYIATVADKQRLQGLGREASEAWTRELQAQGYDGVILNFDTPAARKGSREVVVFDRGDVKSVFNKGEWNRENADLLHQKARGVTTRGPDGRRIITLFESADPSTAIHELGHGWLEDLIADGSAADAPAELKRDVETVLKWLKMENPEALFAKERNSRGKVVYTTAAKNANEQWARGIERYFMEGVAPSRALAKVFDQFRTWLTGIYQTVTRLRTPVNDDIRQVFDRLLSPVPERTIVAPELPLEAGLAERHEALVASTPALEGAKVADNVHRETAEEARAKARRIVNELRIRRGEQPLPESAGPGGREAQRPGVDGGGDATRPGPGGAGDVSAPGAVVSGRGGAAVETPERPAGAVVRDRPQALYARVPKRPTGLIEYLKSRGGVQEHNGEVKALGVGRGLIKPEGLKIDDAALSAYEAGYFPGTSERPTVREFLNAIEDDARTGRFSEHDSDAVAAYEAARSHNAEVDQLASELGIEARGLTYGEFWDKVAERKSLEDLGREVSDRLEAFEGRMAEADRAAKEFLESRGDAWEPDAEAPGASRSLEDLENERAQEAAARRPIEGPGDGGAPGPAGADQGNVQAGGGLGGYGAGPAGGDGSARGQAGGAGEVRRDQQLGGPQAEAGGKSNQPVSDAGEPGPRASQEFADPLPELVDKAGNIRLENLNTGEDVKSVLRDYAEKNGMFMDARRDVVTDQQRLEFAEALGTDANIDHLRAISVEDSVPLAARIEAGRRMLIQSAEAVFKAMNGTDAMAYLEASQRHLRIQETLSGITAEWGRAGRAFRKQAEAAQAAEDLSEFLQSAIGRPLHEVQAEMILGKSLKSPLQVSKFLKDARSPTNTGRVLEVWINALLSGPKTHMANVAGNALTSVYTVAETATAAGIGKLRNLLTGSEDRVFLGEALEQMFALREGTIEGMNAAWSILKDENTINALGLIERPVSGQIGGLLGEIIRAPSRALAAEDAVFKAVAYRQKINQLAYRQARVEGLEGDALARRVTVIKDTPTAAMMKEATDFARYQTFNRELGPIGQATQRLIAQHPAFKFIVPFIRTPANIFKYTVERSPLALGALLQERIGPEVRANLRGERGAIARDQQIARIGLGTSIMVAAYMLAADGVVTGAGPTDPRERQAWFRSGKRPYSVKIMDEYYPINRLEPVASWLGMAGDAWEIRDAADRKEAEDVGKMLLVSIVSNLTSKASLRGPAQFFQFLASPERTFKSYFASQVGTAVPSVFAQAADSLDPYDRQTRGALDRIRSRIPFYREGLPPRRDIWGRPVANDQYGVAGFVLPSMPSKAVDDPVEREMASLGFFPSQVPNKIRGVELTPEEFDRYQQLAGTFARERVEFLMSLPGWEQAAAVKRREMLVDAFSNPRSGAREKARQMVMQEARLQGRDIAAMALANKKALADEMEERAQLGRE